MDALALLQKKRKTIMEFHKGKTDVKEDDWRSGELPASKSTESWKGRTIFRILAGGIESKTSVPAKTRDPARGKKGSPEDLISKGKPEDSSRRTGAAGSSPHGEAPVRRRVRVKGSVPQGTEPKVSAPPLAPEDDPDLQDIDPSLPGDTDQVPRREPEVSSLEPGRVALPLPEASPQYQRMLEKLNNHVELYKLHVKHYHMSSAQFRRRTSVLGLPGEIYDKYDRIVKGCRVCSTSVPTPPRARIAGLRASSFGDLIFVGHEEIKFGNKAYLALIIIDGASNLLWATALTSLEAPETLGVFRQWTEENNCVPKGVVGDQAFFTDQFMAYYKFHGIAPCGPRTPWQIVPRPQFGCSNELGRSWQRPWLTRVMLRRSLFVRQKKVAWARSCQLTVSGYSPLEIATGRRPPDLFDVETSTLEQLSANPSDEDRTTLELQCIAMRAHQEARQSLDLRKDLARRVMPSDCPHQKGDRVFVWHKDESKKKAYGSEELLCHRKVLWCWLKFIALCFE